MSVVNSLLGKMQLFFIFIAIFVAYSKGEQRIAGGNPVTINRYPYAAALLTNSGESSAFVQACGGSVLTSSAILTAASCFVSNGTLHEVSWWRVRVGSSFGNSGGTVYIINRITNHPSFVPSTLANDVAVVRTRLNMVLQPGVVEAAHLVGPAYTFGVNQAVLAIGYGATSASGSSSDQLQETQVWTINQQTCANRYSELNFTVTDSMVCIGWLDVGVRGQCEGDAGSPIVHNGNVVGVFSWASGCADYWFPDINTRVSVFSQWIVSTALA